MPKKAARMLLKIKEISVKRLWDITENECFKEGCEGVRCLCEGTYTCGECGNTGWLVHPILEFIDKWGGQFEKFQLKNFGWEVNPWTWMITFEKIKI